MPSTATITAFYNFTANTKARASQVQGNFDVFRGHLLPVSPSTATAIDNTYDLGSTEYRWRALYLPSTYGTTTADVGGIAYGSKILFTSFNTTTATNIAGTTITISGIGRPIEYSFVPYAADGTNSYIGGGMAAAAAISLGFILMKNGSTAASMSVVGYGNLQLSPSSIKFIDFSATTATTIYSLQAYVISGSLTSANFVRVASYAKELL